MSAIETSASDEIVSDAFESKQRPSVEADCVMDLALKSPVHTEDRNDADDREDNYDPEGREDKDDPDGREDNDDPEGTEDNDDPEGREEKEDEESDDGDDDVTITIGEIKPLDHTPPAYAPINFNIPKRGPTFGQGTGTGTKSKNIGLNIEAVANYNGTPIYDLNLDTITDKPWRKPGADITDYFNYGFNEETWKIYCEKQKKILSDIADGTNNSSSIPKIGTIERSVAPNGNNNQPIPPFTTSGPKTTGAPTQSVTESPIPIASINENSKYSGMGLTKKAGPPPGRKPSGTIDVIGGGTPNSPSMITSRRPPDTPDNFNSMMNQVPPGPGLPPGPFHYPPPPFGMPPPPHAGMDFHLMGPRGINPSMITSIPPSTSYPPPPILDYKMIIKRERDDDGDNDKREREERDKREREERDKRDREERERRSKRRDREERDEREKRERREREKHVKKEFRDEKDRDKRERRDKYDKRHRDDRDDRDEGKKRRTSESDSRDREERVKKEKKDRGEKERRER